MLTVLVPALLAIPVCAQSPPAQERTDGQSHPAEPEPASPPRTETAAPAPPPAPADRGFKPSEEIPADSAVAFPVDI